MSERLEQHIAELAREHTREMLEIMGDSKVQAKKAFLELYAWIPECAPQEVLDAYEDNGAEKNEVPPFFSEVFSYEVLGKDQARTLRALMHSLGEALGFTREEMRQAMTDNTQGNTIPKEKITKDTPLNADDFDALEMEIRSGARHFWPGRERVQVQRALRALNATREVCAAPRDENWQFLRITPDNLRIGDEIVRRGAWDPVVGFIHDDGERFSEKGSKRSQTPVGSKEKDFRNRPKEYLVLTKASPRYGDCFQGREQLNIRRRKEE